MEYEKDLIEYQQLKKQEEKSMYGLVKEGE